MKKFGLSILGFACLITLWLFIPINTSQKTEPRWIFYDRTGEILYQEDHTFTSQAWENNFFETAIIAIEDQNFYTHRGVNTMSLLRALWQNMQQQKIISGASTISMQTARLLFLESESRNYWYKIRQIFWALKLEQQRSKTEILHLYLDNIYWGNGAVGIRAAAQKYFSKTPDSLSIGETTTLIALIQNPSQFDPIAHPEISKERQKMVLKRLHDSSVITNAEYEFWREEKIILNPQLHTSIIAPHFVFWVKNQLQNQSFHEKEIHVSTTLDKTIYQSNLTILRSVLEQQSAKKISSGSIIVLDQQNNIVSMVGSPDFFDANRDGAVNMTTAYRQTGSVLKPFLFALALKNGWSPLQGLNDTKQIFSSGYFPRNFNITEENGLVRFREALANSYNIAAVDLLEKVGLKAFYTFCQQELALDMSASAEDLGLSFILGSGETSLLNLTRAYSVFTSQGNLKPVNGIIKVANEAGEIIWKPPTPVVKKILPLEVAEWTLHVLADDSARWKNFSQGNYLELDFAHGAKTGTSQSFRDNWVIGFSPLYTVGVWAGNPNGSPMHAVSGIQGAGPIWQKTMQKLHPTTAPKKFTYQGSRQETTVCRRPNENICAEKVTAFVTNKELKNNPKYSNTLTQKNLHIIYPQDGSIFLESSDLLIQARGGDSSTWKYIINGNSQTTPIIKNLSVGNHTIQVIDANHKTDVITIVVEKKE